MWTPTGNTAVRASVGTTFQTPQLSELVVPPPDERVPVGGIVFIGNPESPARLRHRIRSGRRADLRQTRTSRSISRSISIRRICARRRTSSKSIRYRTARRGASRSVPDQQAGKRRQRHLPRHRVARRSAARATAAPSRRVGRRQLAISPSFRDRFKTARWSPANNRWDSRCTRPTSDSRTSRRTVSSTARS